MSIYIGTSGFNYPYWKNRFYPEKLASSKWLAYYTTRFNTLELNASFYKFPIVGNLRKMAAQTPDDFKFTVKAHKIITHTKRMRAAADKVNEFMAIVEEGLGSKLACILFQLPPTYTYTEERLNDVVSSVIHKSSNIIEFRHASWWNDEVYKMFKANSLTFCSVSFPGLPEDNVVTSNVFYKRMHGIPELFKSSYTDTQLHDLANSMPRSKDKFIYFNNTMFEAGYSNAGFLKQLKR